MPSLVLTILGADRPGLVESLAELVADHGGNWIESRMAHLAGQFAGILRVDVPAERAAALTDAIAALADDGLDSVVRHDAPPQLAPPSAAAPDQKGHHFSAHQKSAIVHLDLVGQDRPGIVREITRVLASHGVNVEDLSTECTTAAESGQSLFSATADLRLPEGLSAAQLRTALEEVAADLMVDLVLA